MRYRKITVIQTRKPEQASINEELLWLGGSLGLFNTRDKDKSCFRVFISLIKDKGTGMSSDELAETLELTRGTVVHHLNKLIEAGIVIHDKNQYYLQGENIEEVIENIEKNTLKALEDLKNIARELDKKLR